VYLSEDTRLIKFCQMQRRRGIGGLGVSEDQHAILKEIDPRKSNCKQNATIGNNRGINTRIKVSISLQTRTNLVHNFQDEIEEA